MLAWSPTLDPLGEKGMNRKRFKAGKIVNKFREADVPLSKRQMVA